MTPDPVLAAALRDIEGATRTLSDAYWPDVATAARMNQAINKIDAARAAIARSARPEPSPYYDAEGNFIHQPGCSGEEHIGLPCGKSDALRADSHDGEGLDVERLARAMTHHEHGVPGGFRLRSDHLRAWLTSTCGVAIAAEYAALSKEQGRSPEGEG